MADTLTKVLEEADQKLKKAEALEATAVGKEKQAAGLRDEADAKLTKVRLERFNLDTLHTAKELEFARREDDLKNREATLAAGNADLEHKTKETESELTNRADSLTERTVALEQREKVVEQSVEDLNKRANKYADIGKFISDNI